MDSVFEVIEKNSTPVMGSSASEPTGDGRLATDVLRKLAKSLSAAEERKREVAEDIKAIKAQAKISGINVKVFTQAVKLVDDAAIEKARAEDDLREIYVEVLKGGAGLPRSRH